MSDWLEDLADGVVEFIDALGERKGPRMGCNNDRVRLRCARCKQQVPQLVALRDGEPARVCRGCAGQREERSGQ